jgi:hypothetical protein
MIIVHKDVSDLTRGDYQAFYHANFGDEGMMRDNLIRCYKHGSPGHTISLWSSTKRRRLLGWCLMTPVSTNPTLGWAASRWTMRQSKYTVMFWVKWEHRGKGLGKILMDEVHKLDPRPHVLPHDEISEKFFNHHNVMVMNVDRNWRE